MISKLKEEGLWDSLVAEGEMISSTNKQSSLAAIEPSRSTDEASATHESSPVEEAIAQDIAPFSHELGKDDLKNFITLEQRKCFQLDMEFSGDQMEGMTCFMVCSIHSLKRDLQAVGHGRSKVQFDISSSQHCIY